MLTKNDNKMNKVIIITLILTLLLYSLEISAKTRITTPGSENEYVPFSEVMPSIVGGMGALNKQIKYPAEAKQNNISGKVLVLAYINEKGGVDDVKIVKGLGYGCDDAAINAVKNCKFTPGMNNNTPVKVKLTIKVTFET